MSHTPDPDPPLRGPRHPEVFHDKDAGQVFHDEDRPPEPVVMSGLKQGCIWAIVVAAVVLLILALAYKWAFDRPPQDLIEPAERQRPGAEIERPGAEIERPEPLRGQRPVED